MVDCDLCCLVFFVVLFWFGFLGVWDFIVLGLFCEVWDLEIGFDDCLLDVGFLLFINFLELVLGIWVYLEFGCIGEMVWKLVFFSILLMGLFVLGFVILNGLEMKFDEGFIDIWLFLISFWFVFLLEIFFVVWFLFCERVSILFRFFFVFLSLMFSVVGVLYIDLFIFDFRRIFVFRNFILLCRSLMFLFIFMRVELSFVVDSVLFVNCKGGFVKEFVLSFFIYIIFVLFYVIYLDGLVWVMLVIL